MFKLLVVMLSLVATASPVAAASSADLPTREYLNLAAIKTMVAAAEAEAQRQHVEVTICIVDESGNLLFLEKADSVSLNTIQFAQKKARQAAFYKSPSKDARTPSRKATSPPSPIPIFSRTRADSPSSSTDRSWAASPPAAPSPKWTRPSRRPALDALLKK